MQNHTSDLILVSGATGYVASFLIKLLLEKDLKVRGTVRSLANKSSYEFLYEMVPEKNSNLELVEADLSNKSSWESATKGVQYVFHVASPTASSGTPPTEEHYIKPAVEGALSVLEAGLANGVKKVVYTSSIAAVAFERSPKVLTEEDWQSEEGCSSMYARSKIRAEKAVWEFYEKNKEKIEVTVVNPGLIFGPIVTTRGTTSSFVGNIMEGVLPGVFETVVPIVDIRDVAEVHFRAMFREKTNGQRYLCVAESPSLENIARWINKEFGSRGIEVSEEKVTLEEIMKNEKQAVRIIGYVFGSALRFDNQKSVKELGIEYIPVEKTIIDTGNDLLKFGLVKGKSTIEE